MLSWAKDEKLKQMTIDAVKSIYMSENDINFNIIVVESNHDVVYPLPIVTVHLKQPEFNYNLFVNEGIKLGCNETIVFCNNDLHFVKGWATELLLYNYDSMSPMSLTSGSQQKFRNHITPIEGYNIAQEISGWCIFIKRSVWNAIGTLNSEFRFWFADNEYAEQLKEHKIKHYLIPTSIVNHLEQGSNTLKTVDNNTKEQLTYEQARKFNKKFNTNHFNLNNKN